MSEVILEAWIDFGCPWSRFALHELAQAVTEFDGSVDLRLRTLRLDPDAPADYGHTTIEHLCEALSIDDAAAEAMLAPIRERGSQVGLDFNFDIARGGSSFDAHRLSHLAHSYGRQLDLALALFRAHFAEGLLISDHTVLESIAVEVGLPRDRVIDLFSGDEYAADVHEDETQAHLRGIESTPTFVVNDRLELVGDQTTAQFRAAFIEGVR